MDWLWSGGLVLAGALTFAFGGVDRFTIVVGPFLIAASIASVLRQTGRIDLDHEIPGLVIALGVLMLIAQVVKAPSPGWMRAHAAEGTRVQKR